MFIIYLHTVKLFQVLICISSYLIKHNSFVYTQLNDQIVVFKKIQFNMSFFCTQFKCETVLFHPYRGPYRMVPLWVKVNLEVMGMTRNSTFHKAPALLEPPLHIV